LLATALVNVPTDVDMTRAACAVFVILASCSSEDSAGTNPPTLWLAMATGSQMQLVAEEPHPY